eukprot:m.343532 g.343532  ORF g.343532 m.343532 type:complete len:116 (-) comp55782_c1_seq4:2296-2643(-)
MQIGLEELARQQLLWTLQVGNDIIQRSNLSSSLVFDDGNVLSQKQGSRGRKERGKKRTSHHQSSCESVTRWLYMFLPLNPRRCLGITSCMKSFSWLGNQALRLSSCVALSMTLKK